MSRLAELIAELCLEVVEYKTLRETRELRIMRIIQEQQKASGIYENLLAS